MCLAGDSTISQWIVLNKICLCIECFFCYSVGFAKSSDNTAKRYACLFVLIAPFFLCYFRDIVYAVVLSVYGNKPVVRTLYL